MNRDSTFNFSAGPSVLPEKALLQAQADLMNFNSCGYSIMEMSHRSKMYQEVFDETKSLLKEIMNVPDTHEILFLQGGATLQFASVPLNLISKTGKASYAITGNFSNIAYNEAKKYGESLVACSSEDRNFSYIPKQNELKIDQESSYFHYCANNTIYGTEWHYVPDAGNVTMVSDMSSDILTQKVDFSKYGLVYAGAQKNMAPAGVTVVFVDKSIVGKALDITPQVMDYKIMIDKDSMLNTPPCWCIYMLGLNLKWVKEVGGIDAMEDRKIKRSKLLYDVLDSSTFYKAHADEDSRSYMNVTFRTKSDELDNEFVNGAAKLGLMNLKGHRKTGGIRASIYNAMPLEGCELLAKYMRKFEEEHR